MMAFAHDMSCECTKSELSLFSVPPTQTSMEHGNWVEYHPLTTATDGSPTLYVDFANTMLHVKAKVTHGNDTDLAAGVTKYNRPLNRSPSVGFCDVEKFAPCHKIRPRQRNIIAPVL